MQIDLYRQIDRHMINNKKHRLPPPSPHHPSCKLLKIDLSKFIGII